MKFSIYRLLSPSLLLAALERQAREIQCFLYIPHFRQMWLMPSPNRALNHAAPSQPECFLCPVRGGGLGRNRTKFKRKE
jgi:hypothetical protein